MTVYKVVTAKEAASIREIGFVEKPVSMYGRKRKGVLLMEHPLHEGVRTHHNTLPVDLEILRVGLESEQLNGHLIGKHLPNCRAWAVPADVASAHLLPARPRCTGNHYTIDGDVVRMKVYRYTEPVTVVFDRADLERVKRYQWCMFSRRDGSIEPITRPKGGTPMLLRRLIMNVSSDAVVECINSDWLDCRRANLRVGGVTQTRLATPRLGPTGQRYIRISGSGFIVQIWRKDRCITVGSFRKLEAAVEARDAWLADEAKGKA